FQTLPVGAEDSSRPDLCDIPSLSRTRVDAGEGVGMSPPVRVLIGLGLGLASGFALAHANVPPDSILVTTADTIGGLWIAALRMTILPLVFSLVVTGVATRVEANSAGG